MPASTFEEILKFNPYHDSKGRFASAGGAASFTYSPGKSKAHDMAIARERERMSGIMPTEAQSKTLKAIERKTRNLKKEQLRVVDRDGNVVMQKQGDKGSVTYKVGEARDHFPGNITIHNHPEGGTFSTPDLSDFGYGATEIRAASPEGTYTLRNMNYKTKWVKDGKTWLDMQEDLEAASEGFKSSRKIKSEIRGTYEEQVKPIVDRWAERKAAGASWDELNAIAKEHEEKWNSLKPQLEADVRAAYVDQYHHWYKANAGNYGFEYTFEPAKVKKSYFQDDMKEIENELKKGEDVVLDRKMNDDIAEMVEAIMNEISPRDLMEGLKKSASVHKLFVGLTITGAASLAIDGGEAEEDYHVTLAYGTFDANGADEDTIDATVQEAIGEIREWIPDEIQFDAIGRFEASESSDGQDVIYAQVAGGQLEVAHEELLNALEDRNIVLKDTFPEYHPHMTLAYIDPGKDHKLEKIDVKGTVGKIMIGHGIESTHENNYTIEKSEDSSTYQIMKTDEDKRLVFGWASVSIKTDGKQLEDCQEDMIDPEDLEEAVYDYVLNFRDTGEEHIPTLRMKGKLVESCMFTEEKQRAMGIPEGILPIGWWIGFKIFDDDAWEKVKNRTYKMFSIEGRAERVEIEKSNGGHNVRNIDHIIELPERPAVVKSDSRYDIIEEAPVAKSFNDILKFNPYHDSKGRFASANGAASFTYSPGKSKAHDNAIARERERVARQNRSYGATGTKDVVDEINSGKHNSLEKYLDENGNLTPEREAVHKQIIDDLLAGKVPVKGQATMTMLGGGPASGKSSVMNPDTSKDPNAVTVDPDAIKKMLPGFAEMAKASPNAAAYYHEESSALAKRFSEVAYKENYNVVYDGTGDGSPNSVQKKIDGARANGYRVEAKYVSIDTEEAVRRNQKRYDDAVAKGETPRLPPVEMVIATHTKCTDISVAKASEFDHIEIWDNNGARGQQKLIATGGNGSGLKVVSGQEASFDRYLSKGAKGLEGFTTLPDGTVIPVE